MEWQPIDTGIKGDIITVCMDREIPENSGGSGGFGEVLHEKVTEQPETVKERP